MSFQILIMTNSPAVIASFSVIRRVVVGGLDGLRMVDDEILEDLDRSLRQRYHHIMTEYYGLWDEVDITTIPSFERRRMYHASIQILGLVRDLDIVAQRAWDMSP